MTNQTSSTRRKPNLFITPKTRIPFGKLKHSQHSDLLLPINSKYAQWIIDQGPDFRYPETRNFILENRKNYVKELTPSEWEYLTSEAHKRELTEDEEKSVDHFNNFLLRMEEISTPSEDEIKS